MGSKGIEYAAFVLTVIAVIVVVQWQINRLSKRKLTLSIFQVARRWTIVFYIVTALFLAFGVWYVSWFEANEYKEYKRFSEHFTKVFSTELFELHHESLNDETKETNPTYIHILKAMLRWQHDHPEIHNWYTLKKNKDGENYFVVAPEMDYNHNGIIDGKKEQRVPIGTVYRKRIPELEEAFQGKFSMQKEPTSNNWGENISAFSPIFDKSGKVNAVIGIDYDAKGYLKKLQQEREKGIAILFLMFLVYYAVYVLVIYIQIEKRLFQKHKKELEISQARFKRLSEVTMEGIVIHSQGKVVEVNESACRLFGYTESEFVHLPIEDLIVPESLKKLKNNGCREGTYEIDLRRKDGTRFPAEILQRDYEYDSKRVSVTAIRDITERKQNEEKMHYITFHDDLTGLPNKESLYQIITEHMKEGSQQAVMFIEMNGIKMINDLYGYSVGDQVLLGAASQIQKIMNDHMVLGRWGGNEFILIFPHIHRKEEVKEFAAQMIETLEEPIVVNDQEFFITARIGISLYPHDGTDAKTLIKKADIARYELGKKATSQYLFFKEQMNQTIQEKMTIEQELRRALEDGEFELYYQPQIRLDTGTVTGMEALIRWNHPEKGLIAPDTFIPVAEQTGFIIPINEWVIRTACQQTKLLLDEYPFLSVSVNLSPYEFESRRFVHKLVKILEETGLPPYCLDLEITERMAMDTEKAIAILHRLKSVGVMISMDDFGTGYSSLSYLKHLPIDRLKIDRSFVRNIQEEEAILPAIISLGHNIGMKVLAEGVETGQEVAYLKEKRCDEAQGYYYAKPLPFHEFVEFLRQYSQTKPRV
ncbi:putative bifunctional diguanylate cyclase/phosphodiesterase [Thermaerobacillus caldiproteolyticus]|uniref:Diguanylate cyclase (GGDEF)-like protein/PAS domain S-box-containing protein n=1 Tax=Thermaerobacillus caldiproteolyticus TaxID=247480 RepID=A0A7V9Z9N7_9BACL|nr:bifunctional diguanylate cyclase/phosphodiesterase [Anoxybacillus caldiproteolyticus]MBA2876619.1 diguanylate cyclase (GGDEF)-like protein/PAS domain S-box-containing protein [Anoxybacillus caldiproteolyticus]QPA33344.1 GGDEF domain-containing protein [Anoxybacillus caldiproteolyticus]